MGSGLTPVHRPTLVSDADRLRWSSNLQGERCTGPEVAVPDVPAVTHLIAEWAIDSQGQSGMAMARAGMDMPLP